ncbi:MAG: hypothetical protein AAF744_02475 [Pseudomonadota bacterium]
MLTLAISLLTALPAFAGDLMTAEEFEAYTTGKTLFYGRDGTAYGAEIYHENRRVQWSFLDGECKEGSWYAAGEMICFVYEDNPDPQCWTFRLGTGGLIARFENNPASDVLYEARDRGEELLCLGPKVGV